MARCCSQSPRNNGGSLNIPDDYAAVKAMAQTGVKLPMTPGPARLRLGRRTEQGGGGESTETKTLFVNLLWHGPSAISQGAMVFDITPQTTRLAEVKVDDVRFDFSGNYNTAGGSVEEGLGRWLVEDTAGQSSECR